MWLLFTTQDQKTPKGITKFKPQVLLSWIPVAAQFKAWVCSRLLAGIADSNPAGDMDVCTLLSVVCCQVEVSVTGRFLVQRSPTEWMCVTACE
jgi:hypothetical protein